MFRLKPASYSYLIIGLCSLLFLPFLGGVNLFDWDEINFAECAREMIVLNDYLRVHINFEPFWEKPPFFFWLQAGAMHLFGINEYAARFPNAICGILTVWLLFKIGSRLHDKTFGVIWSLVYMGSFLPHLYFKSGIIDPYFNLFIFLGLYWFILSYWKNDSIELELKYTSKRYLVLSGLATGLAILTKGQVAYLILALTVGIYLALKKFRTKIKWLDLFLVSIIALVPMIAYYGIETILNGPWLITEFIRYQYRLLSTPDAGHGGFFGYHFVVLLLGCFPASLFTIQSFFSKNDTDKKFQRDFKKWMTILFWVVLILFTLVKSKIVHYSSICYFPLTYLAGTFIYSSIKSKSKVPSWIIISIGAIGSLLSFVLFALPQLIKRKELIIPYIKDPFAVSNLEANITWTGWESIVGILFLITTVLLIRSLKKQQYQIALYTFVIGNVITLHSFLYLFTGKIEGYSQRTAIEFYESLEGKSCYVVSLHKSYAPFFYSKRQPADYSAILSKEQLLTGEIDKPVYAVCKITQVKHIKERYPELIELERKDGFVFFERISSKK